MQPATRSSNQPLGTSGDWRRRFLRHHVPLALASAVVLVLFMTLSPFDANSSSPLGNIFTGRFPQENFPDSPGGGQTGPADQGEDHQIPPEILEQIEQQGGDHQIPQQGGGETSSSDVIGSDSFLGLNTRQFTFATGYVALGLLGLTLLVGPANLLLRRRNPVSNYLSRDVGTWAAIGSVVHVIYAFGVHGSGDILNNAFFDYFIADGSPLTNSFGLANWTGLAATAIVVGLLAISSDFALRKLKARTWKWLQRTNYALFALVIAHAFFYGALLRLESPFTLLLGLSVIAVFVGQTVGVWLWRRRYARRTAKEPA